MKVPQYENRVAPEPLPPHGRKRLHLWPALLAKAWPPPAQIWPKE